MKLCTTLAVLGAIFLFSLPAEGQSAEDESLATWLNKKIEGAVQARLDQRSNTNQTEAPSQSANSTSLVDQTSASDLVGIGLHLADLSASNRDNTDATSASATASAYAAYAALSGANPLDPSFYNANRDWRRVSITLGYDRQQTSTTTNSKDQATLAGAKVLLLNNREAAKHPDELKIVVHSLEKAGSQFGKLTADIQRLIYENPTVQKRLGIQHHLDFERQLTWDEAQLTEWTNYQNDHFSKEGFPLVLAILGDDGVRQVTHLIEQQLDAFVELDRAAQQAIAAIRRAPQASISFLSKTAREGVDEYDGEFIVDYGLADRLNLTLNAAFEFRDNPTGADSRGGKASGQLQFQVTPENRLAGRKPIVVTLAGNGKWMEAMGPMYEAQLKLTVPLFDGVDLPVSITYANRTELIDEAVVRGQFGFSFDTARIFNAVGLR